MPIKNYTTKVPVARSMGEIQGKLVAHGARSIMINYGPDEAPESLSFIVPTSEGNIPFRLSANVKGVETLLLNMRSRQPEKWYSGYKEVMERNRKQAARVAWRIIKDWVDAQLALIETEMATMEQVFLPYMLVKGGQQTLYEVMADRGFYLPEGRG